jgi:hypothetical protein
MPLTSYDICRWIKAVEKEHAVVAIAVEIFQEKLRSDPDALLAREDSKKNQLRVRDLQIAIDRLESTYLIRLFAVFESGLRSYWEDILSRSSVPKMQDLVNSVAGQWQIGIDLVRDVHEVRKYRNFLVHSGEFVPKVAMADARARLCTFVSRWR